MSARRLSTYEPANEKVTVVWAAAALAKVTVPGPLVFDHVVVMVPTGYPESVTAPFNTALLGSVTVWAEPALTTGGRVAGAGVPDVRRTTNALNSEDVCTGCTGRFPKLGYTRVFSVVT